MERDRQTDKDIDRYERTFIQGYIMKNNGYV